MSALPHLRKFKLMHQNDDVNPLTSEKWVRVMADFASVGIWAKSGVMGDLDDLPVSRDTAFMLGNWQHWFEARRHDQPIPSWEKFVKYGWQIVWDISRQLPDWTVVYHDETYGCDVIAVKIWFKKK